MEEDVGFAVMVKTDCPHISEHLNMDLADLSLASKIRKKQILSKKNFFSHQRMFSLQQSTRKLDVPQMWTSMLFKIHQRTHGNSRF
jgi:hypothetical protein